MTAIEWTDQTWNPTTGCDRVSPGCDNCYALTMAKRLKAMGSEKYQRDGDPRTSGPGFGVSVHEDVLARPFSWRTPKRVFVNSMSDLFHKDIPDAFIARVFATMAATPQHTYQVLTKRHARMRSLLSRPSFPELVTTWAWRDHGGAPTINHRGLFPHPLPNVWLGVSVEDQHWADIRIPALQDTPAAVRFLSCEPLLGPVSLRDYVGGQRGHAGRHHGTGDEDCPRSLHHHHDARCLPGIDWVITGGESGPGARPMHPDWARKLRDQCADAGVPFLFKQWGAWGPTNHVGAGVGEPDEVCLPDSSVKQLRPDFQEGRWFKRVGKKVAGRLLDGRTWDEYPAGVLLEIANGGES